MKVFIALAFLAVASALPQPLKLPETAVPYVEEKNVIHETVQVNEQIFDVPIKAIKIVEAAEYASSPKEMVQVVDAFVNEEKSVDAPVDAVKIVDAPLNVDAPLKTEGAPEMIRVVDAPLETEGAPEMVRVVDAPLEIEGAPEMVRVVDAPLDVVRVVDAPLKTESAPEMVKVVEAVENGFEKISLSELETIRVMAVPEEFDHLINQMINEFVRVVDNLDQSDIRQIKYPNPLLRSKV